MTAEEQALHAFICTTFRSVWAIELLCHVRARGDQWLERAEIVAALRASDPVVDQGLSDLRAAGLVVADESGRIRYAPANPDLDGLAAESETLYAKAPNLVRRMIIAATNPGITAFADAFKLRRD